VGPRGANVATEAEKTGYKLQKPVIWSKNGGEASWGKKVLSTTFLGPRKARGESGRDPLRLRGRVAQEYKTCSWPCSKKGRDITKS